MNEQNTEKSPEEIKKENKSMIRACVIGIVVLAAFAAVYFVAGGRGDGDADKPAQKTEHKMEMPENKEENKAENKEESKEEKSQPESKETENSEKNEESVDIYKKYDIKYTREEALAEAEKAAKKQFGDDAFVIPASEETPSEVEIDGKNRACYMFGADSMSHLSSENASMRGLYHFDAVTGEIFDNADGNMTKIN